MSCDLTSYQVISEASTNLNILTFRSSLQIPAKTCAAISNEARIVPVSSVGHTWTKKGIDFEDINWEKRDYDAYEVPSLSSLVPKKTGFHVVLLEKKWSGLGKCKGGAGGPCNQCNDSLVIGVFFQRCIRFYVQLMIDVSVCVCYKSVVKTEEFLHDTGYQPEASKSLQFEKRRPSISKPAANTHTHRQTQFILHTQLHTESVYEMLIVAPKRRCQS